MNTKINWKKYALEFLSIFIAVIAAFALNNWNENRRDRNAETKILSEIRNGLEKDKLDIDVNVKGHQDGRKACVYFRNLLDNKPVNLDSFPQYYLDLNRDFVTIHNNGGYEALKSKGLEIIVNDSLRLDIVSFYEYDFMTLEKLEENYGEIQFHDSYYHDFNRILSPYFVFDSLNNISVQPPLTLNKVDKNILLGDLWKINLNRRFMIHYYKVVKKKSEEIIERIEEEIGK